MARFNPAPGWPAPPAGWLPPAGWQPDPSWPPAPPDWQFWVPQDATTSSAGVLGEVGQNPVNGPTPVAERPVDPDLARTWVAEITRLAERRRGNAMSRVTLIAPPVKGGLLGRIVMIGVGAALSGSVNDAVAEGNKGSIDGAVSLPDSCLLCGLLPGAVNDIAEITIDASTLGLFLGGELLSQQKVGLPFHLCRECAVTTVRPLGPLVIESYRKVGNDWLLSLLLLNDRVADSVRALNRPRLITVRKCLQCGHIEDDQAWFAREDVCPVCHHLYAGGRAWLCPRCGKNLPYALLATPRAPKTWRQAMWGGINCPRCGADVPKP